jgi:7-keto-8-aminopelargonate synthetase-like enzyme
LADIEVVRGEIVARQLPVLSLATTPIWYIRVGGPESVADMVHRLMKDGFYLNAAAYPAVPMGFGGVRFTQTLHNTPEQAIDLIDAIGHHLPQVTSDPDIIVDLRYEADALVIDAESDTT